MIQDLMEFDNPGKWGFNQSIRGGKNYFKDFIDILPMRFFSFQLVQDSIV